MPTPKKPASAPEKGDGRAPSHTEAPSRPRLPIPALPRLPRAIVVGGLSALLVAAANIAMMTAVAHWRQEEQGLIRANAERGTETSTAEAASEEQASLLALLERQLAAARERLAEIDQAQLEKVAVLDEVRGGIAGLLRCTDAQDDLIAYLWTTKTSLDGGDRVDAVDARCSQAKSAFKKVRLDD